MDSNIDWIRIKDGWQDFAFEGYKVSPVGRDLVYRRQPPSAVPPPPIPRPVDLNPLAGNECLSKH